MGQSPDQAASVRRSFLIYPEESAHPSDHKGARAQKRDVPMSRYLVTGGCGFIGSHLAQGLIERGDEVIILDDLSTGKRENAPVGAELVVGNVADLDTVRRAMTGADGCFHLAAIASVERAREAWHATHAINLGGTICVLEAARNPGRHGPIPVVYASSAAVYGDNPDSPLSEKAVTAPISAYGADKLGCELHARIAYAVHKIPTVGLRVFNAYGPRQDPSSPYSGVISIFAGRLAGGEAIEIFGDGNQVRDFVYVGDVVTHFVRAMTLTPREALVLNLCTGRGTTINELAQTLWRILDREPEIRYGPPRLGDIRRSTGDPAQARHVLGIKAEVDLAAGLRCSLDWLAEKKRPAGVAGRDGA